MSIETVSVEQTMGKYDEAEVKRWDGGIGLRCGLGGPPSVVVTPFGRLRDGSNHHVEAASLTCSGACR